MRLDLTTTAGGLIARQSSTSVSARLRALSHGNPPGGARLKTTMIQAMLAGENFWTLRHT